MIHTFLALRCHLRYHDWPQRLPKGQLFARRLIYQEGMKVVNFHIGLAGFAAASIFVALLVRENVWIRTLALILGLGAGGYWLLWFFTDDPIRMLSALLG